MAQAPESSWSRLTIEVMSPHGLVEVQSGPHRGTAVLEGAPSHVRLGARIALRAHASSLTGDPGRMGMLELKGRVAKLQDAPRGATGARVQEGLRFAFDLESVSDASEKEDLQGDERVRELSALASAPASDEGEAVDDAPTLALPPPRPFVMPALAVPPPCAELDLGPSAPEGHAEAPDDTEPSGLFGTLRELSLAELLQSLEMSRKTAAVHIRPKDGPSGEVYVEEGRVVYARAGELFGEEAFFAVAHCRRGSFRVRFHIAPPERNIDRPTAYLILEAHRRLDESSRDDLPEMKEAQAIAEAPLAAEAQKATPSQLDDDAPTASERPCPRPPSAPEADDALDDEALVDTEAEPEESRPSGGSPFSHFFEEASGGVPRAPRPGVDVKDLTEGTLTFTSLRVRLPSFSSEDDPAQAPQF